MTKESLELYYNQSKEIAPQSKMENLIRQNNENLPICAWTDNFDNMISVSVRIEMLILLIAMKFKLLDLCYIHQVF
jgi:hypothetical protein